MTDNDKPDDAYERTRFTSDPASLIDKVKNFEPPTLGYSPEWWERRDREVAEQRAKNAAAQEQSRMTNRAGELRDNGFPEMFVSLALGGGTPPGDGGDGGFFDTPAMKWARTFVHLPKKLLILAGGVGAGKTTAATWITLKGNDPRPGFVRIGELERRGRYDKKLDEWLKEKTSLVIDDVGTEVLDGKNVFSALFGEIVDAFYSNRRVLVMTTNLRPRRKSADEQEQFLERYGERVWSRLNQMAVWADCGTRDLRREPQP